MKKFFALFLVLSTIALVGCWSNYSGDNPDLYTVAVNSLLWNQGMSFQADWACDPTIKVIEKDDYGRVLFLYTEKSFSPKVAFSSILIMQSSSNGYAYYYEDCNFICIDNTSHINEFADFDTKNVEKLKLTNDWNKPLNLEKCKKTEINNLKVKQPIEEKKLEEIFSTRYNNYKYNVTFFLTEDNQGRFICYSRVVLDENNSYPEKYLVLLFEKDLSYSIFEPSSLYDYQEELKDFKQSHNWNVA